MKQIIPPNLNPGDTIGIIATARWILPEVLEPALDIIRGWGFRIKCGQFLHKQFFQLAGTDDERGRDFQEMLDDDAVKAIIVVRGGYGTVRMIDRVDFSAFVAKPKWICGYSDITVIHDIVNSLGVASLHSSMPVSFAENPPHVLESIKLALCGKTPDIEFLSDWIVQSPGQNFDIQGRLLGGNLSVLYSLTGSRQDANNDGAILFLEDIDEYLYHIDRMLMGLKRSGALRGLRAIIVGGMTDLKDNTTRFGFKSDNPWGKSVEDMFSEIIGDVGIPIISGVPAGHQADNRTLRLGAKVEISVVDRHTTIRF